MIQPTHFATAVLICAWLALCPAVSACKAAADTSASSSPPQPQAVPDVTTTPSPAVAEPSASSPQPTAAQACHLEGAKARPTPSLKSRGLVIEYQWSRRGPDDRDRFGMRVAKSGGIEVLSSGQTDFIDGKLVTKKIPLAWRKHGRLSAGEQTRLADAIRGSGFFELPCEINRERKIHDGGGFSLAVALDDKEVMIGGTDADNSVVQKIVTLLTELSAAADERSQK